MDTRKKIISFETLPAVLAEGEWLAVAGFFDPLTAIQAKRLAELGGNGGRTANVLAIVLQEEGTLLAAEARAILMASLRSVKAVLIAQPRGWREQIPKDARVQLIDDTENDRVRSAEFGQFVIRRQQSVDGGSGQNTA